MKKLNYLTAVLAGAALVLGSLNLASCAADAGDGGTVNSTPVLRSISVNTDNATKVFAVGDEFSSSGVTIRAVYSNGSKNISSGFDVDIPAANLELKDDKSVLKLSEGATGHSEDVTATVTFGGKSATYTVKVAEKPVKIQADFSSAKTSYDKGDTADSLTVKAFYSAEDTTGEAVTAALVTKDGEGKTSAFSTAEAGTFTVYAEYLGLVSEESVSVTVINSYTAEFVNGSNDDSNSNPGKMYYWNDQNWCGSNVTINSSSSKNGVYVLNYSSTGACDFGIQFFMAQNLTAGKEYLSVYTIESDVERKVTCNGTAYTLAAGTPVTVATHVSGDGSIPVLSIQVKIADNAAGTIKVSDVKYFEYNSSALIFTGITASAASEEIAVGDKVAVNVTGNYSYTTSEGTVYTIRKAVTDAVLSADSSVTIDGLNVTAVSAADATEITATKGEFTAKVQVKIIAGKEYSKYFKAGSQTGESDLQTAGYMALWYVADIGWNCGDVVNLSSAEASASSYKVVRESTGTNTWSTQMFWKENTGKYKVSFKAKSSAAGDITVSGTNYSLEADTPVLVEYEKELSGLATLISIQLGGAAGILPAGTFEITDFSVTQVTE